MRCSTIYYNLFVLSGDVMVVISLELLLVVVTAALPLTSMCSSFLNNKEVYCHQHYSLGDEEERVEEKEMCVDRCVLIHTDNERPGRKIFKTISPDTFRIKIGE